MVEHPAPAPPDRREALKARHRRAIVDAAAALMAEIGGTHFTVDELAGRSGVARRTVFNHFATMDDVVLEVFSEMLETILRGIDAELSARAAEPSGATPVFDRLTEALRATDLVTPIIALTRIFGGDCPSLQPRQEVLFERAINDLGARISQTVLRHHPRADAFEVEVMCGAVVSGALVAHRHWSGATGGADTPESRRVWNELLDRLIAVTRRGYGARDHDAG